MMITSIKNVRVVAIPPLDEPGIKAALAKAVDLFSEEIKRCAEGDSRDKLIAERNTLKSLYVGFCD